MELIGVTLVMDASAGNGTIAVLRDGALAAEADVVMRSEREERFFPAVLATLARAAASLEDLQRIIVGGGPGSFTALRVVGALAKGLAQGRGIPLYAVPSLALIYPPALPSSGASPAASHWVATLDALRGERYAAHVVRGVLAQVVRVEILGVVAAGALSEQAAALDAQLVGPDETLAASPRASAVIHCLTLLRDAAPVDLASWEPVYGRLAEAQVKWEAAHGRALG